MLAIEKRLKTFIQYLNYCELPKLMSLIVEKILSTNCCLKNGVENENKYSDWKYMEVSKTLTLDYMEVYSNFVFNLLSVYQLLTTSEIKNIMDFYK